MKYKLKRCRSTNSVLPYAMPALQTPPTSTSARLPRRCSGTLKPVGQGRYKRSLRTTENAMTTACETSDPLMPARILMLFVEKVERSAMYK
jgi:hypothetical protein